jgi:hypothetical protein
MACSVRMDPVPFPTPPQANSRPPYPSLIRRPIAAPWGRQLVTESCDERRATEAYHGPWDTTTVYARSSITSSCHHYSAPHSCTQPPRKLLSRDGIDREARPSREQGDVTRVRGRPIDPSSGNPHAWENGWPAVRWGWGAPPGSARHGGRSVGERRCRGHCAAPWGRAAQRG